MVCPDRATMSLTDLTGEMHAHDTSVHGETSLLGPISKASGHLCRCDDKTASGLVLTLISL